MSLLHVKKTAAMALAGVLMFGVAGCSVGDAPSASPTSGSGYQAGDGSFTLWEAAERGETVTISGNDLRGHAVDTSQWKGDVVVVNFWYASCPPCRAEAPDLKALAEEFDSVHFLGVNPRDEAAAAAAFEETFEIPYPSILDPEAGVVAAMQGKVPLQAMPSTVVLDTEGRVASRVLGRIDPDILRGLIEDTQKESADGSR